MQVGFNLTVPERPREKICVCHNDVCTIEFIVTFNILIAVIHSSLLVVYNRVPKCGSTTMLSLIRSLRKRNGFKSMISHINNKMHITEQAQVTVLSTVLAVMILAYL